MRSRNDIIRVQPDELLTTHNLYRRRARAAPLEAELKAYHELSVLMASNPVASIQRFLELALELCPAAGSAGLSELIEEDGERIFRWTAMSGALAPYVGGTTPRDFSPCGLCLDNHHTILVDRPYRLFTYFNDASPRITEGLIVPLYDTGKRPIGTLWVTSHSAAKFDPTDARVMEQLAVQLVLAIKLRRKAKILVQLEETARDREVLVHEVRHRVKNMIQMTSALLDLQHRELKADEARTALREAQHRLLVLASVYETLLQPGADVREVNVCALVERLIQALVDSSTCGHSITIESDCRDLQLSVDQAVPLGLIVNEAVTNAMKHAFHGRPGKVSLRLTQEGADCSLTVRDDGRGLDGPPREGSLGMRLMKNLSRQLRGKLTINSGVGTTVLLRWPLVPSTPGETQLQPVSRGNAPYRQD
jgi:two-component sensor histidine kinase